MNLRGCSQPHVGLTSTLGSQLIPHAKIDGTRACHCLSAISNAASGWRANITPAEATKEEHVQRASLMRHAQDSKRERETARRAARRAA